MHWRKEIERLRPLAISLAKDNEVFHKLPNNTFGLVSRCENISAKILKRRKREGFPGLGRERKGGKHEEG
jgi:hypothetical protein